MLALSSMSVIPARARPLIVTGVGLSSIPLLIAPIDHGVHVLMNGSRRRIGKSIIEKVLVDKYTAERVYLPGYEKENEHH